MSARYFVDTNILLYAHDRAAGIKHERAKKLVAELWNTRSGFLSTQVLQEFAVNLRRKVANPPDQKLMREILRDYLTWPIVVNTGDSIVAAIDLEERFQVSFWDALILHAASTCGADILLSEDLSDGQKYGSVRVLNPLKSE